MTRIIRECRYWWKDLFFQLAKQDDGRYAFLKFLDHDTVKIAWLWRKDDTHKLWISRGTILKDYHDPEHKDDV